MAKHKDGDHFDEFDVDDLDFDFEDPGLHPEKDNRKPIVRFGKGFYEGLKEKAKSPSFYRKLLTKALPSEYEHVFDAVDGIADAGADLYNTSASKLAPTVRAIKKKTRSILPTSEKYISKALQDKLKSWAEDDYEGTGAQFNPAQQREAQIGIDLGDMFATQITESAKQYDGAVRRDTLRAVMEGRRHGQSLRGLDSVNQGINRLVGYQDNITIKYQRKSLELQYRHLYATRDLIETFNDKSNKNLEALQGILKNTGLPDAVKLKKSEAFGNIARDRFINKIQNGAGFGGIDKLIERITGNAKRIVGEKIDSINSAVEGLTSTGEMTEGMDRWNMGGNVVGGELLNGIAGSEKITGPLGQFLAKNPKLMSFMARSSSAIKNANGHLDAFSKSKTDIDESTLKGRAKGSFINTLKDLVRGPADTDISAGDMVESANDASSFTVLARRSITDVIPGYLARILREVTINNTGDHKTPLITYNLHRQSFDDANQNRKDFLKRIVGKDGIVLKKEKKVGLFNKGQAEVKSSTGSYVNEMVDKIDPQRKLSDAARKALSRQLLHNSLGGKGFIPKQLASPTNYHANIGRRQKVELSKFFRTEYQTQQHRELGEGLDIDKRESEVSSNFNFLAQNVPAIIDEIELILTIPEGREHLESLGFLKYDGKVSKLNYDAIIDFILGNGSAASNSSPSLGGGGGGNATKGGTASTNRSGGSSQTYSFSGYGAAYTLGGNRNRSTGFGQKHNPVDSFRDVVGAALSQGKVFKTNAISKIKDTTEKARELSSPAASRADQILNDVKQKFPGQFQAAKARLNSLKGKLPDYVRSADDLFNYLKEQSSGQLSAGKAKFQYLGNAATDRFGNLKGRVPGYIANAKDSFDNLNNQVPGYLKAGKAGFDNLSNQASGYITAGMSEAEKLKARAAGYLGNGKTRGDAAVNNLQERIQAAKTKAQANGSQIASNAKAAAADLESSLINAYTEARKAQGESVTLDGIKDWMSGARKLVSDKLRTGISFASLKSFKFGSNRENSGEASGGETTANGQDDFKDNVIKLLTQNNTSLEDIKDLLQAGIHLHTNEAGGDGRKYGFRYGLRSGVGKLMHGAGALLGSGMKFYGKGLSAVGSVLKGAGGIAGGVLSRLGLGIRRYSDIYVKGNPHPVLFAKGIKQGIYTDVITQKVIRNLKDIKGPVVDNEGNQVISLEDFQKGLYDTQKKPILNRILFGAIGFYGKLLTPFTTAAAMAVGTLKWVTKKLTQQKDIYVKGEPLPRMRASIMAVGGYISQRTKKPILSFKDLDGPVIDRSGNIILSNDDIKQGLVDVNGKDLKTLGDRLWNIGAKAIGFGFGIAKGIVKTGWAMGMGALRMAKGVGIKSYNFLMRGFGLSQVEAVTLGNSNSTVNLLQQIHDILDDRLPARKKRILGDSDDDGIRDNSVADKLRRRKAALEAATAKRAGGAGGAGIWGGLGDKLKGLFGKKDEESEEEGDTNIIGSIGGGKDKVPKPAKPLGRMGRAWERVKGVGRKVPGARFLGKGLGWLGRGAGLIGRLGLGLMGLEAAGVGGALLTAGGAIVSGAGALLAGIATVVASPIVLGALAVTAVAVGGYYAYKYLSGANNTDFKNIRIAQYGIDPTKEDQAGKVVALEGQVEKYVSLNGPTADLKMPAEAIAKAMQDFGVDTNDDGKIEAWVTWFNERFKQVYVMHRAACEKVVPGSDLSKMDAKWSKAQKSEALKLLKKDSDYTPYGITASPFPGPMSGSRQIIAKMFDEAEKNFAEKEKTDAQKATTFAPVIGIAGMLSGSSYNPIGEKPKGNGTPVDVKQLTAKAALTNSFNMSGTITATGSFSGLSKTAANLTAMDCVRYKAYGLVTLDISKVRVLQDLEKSIIDKITFSTKGEASFEGDAQEYLDKYSSMFGVSASNTKLVSDWTVWFSTRFIPVLVAYCTAVREQNKTVMILDAAQYLKAEQLLSVAQSIIAAKTGGFFSSSIWSIPHSPWADYVLNSDSGSTKGNIDSLTLAVKNRAYSDATAIISTVTAGLNSDKEKGREGEGSIFPTNKDADKPASIFSTMSNVIIGQKSAPKNLVERAVEGQQSTSFGNNTYQMPVEGRISSAFGMRDHPITGEEKEHKGVDIAAPNGTPVRAAADGTIMIRSYLQGYGNAIYIRHPDGKSTRYAHMSSFQVGLGVGSDVKKGQIIGYVGSTGGSTGNHLHFEIREGAGNEARPIDPIKFLGDKKAEDDIKELKGYQNVVEKGTGTESDGPVTEAPPLPGAQVAVDAQAAPMAPATVEPPKGSITDSLKVMAPPAQANSLLTVPLAAGDDDPDAAAIMDARRKQQEYVQSRSIENRNRAESERAAADMSAVVEVLNRSYDVQVQMRDGITGLGVAIQSLGESKAEATPKPTGAANPGRRPTAVAMKSNPVSMKKTGY